MSMLLALVASSAELPPICTDRPAKANAVCTVPAGKFQVESSLAGWSLTNAGGARTSVLTIASSTVKLGVTDKSDLQISMTPYARLKVRGAASASGFGDLVVRYKRRLTNDSAPVQVAAIPFLKLPTAAHQIGNGKAEGGLAIPVSFALAGPVTMTLGPEADLLIDSDGRGRHLAVMNLVNLSAPIAPRLTLAGELWSNLNFDPTGTVRQASADVALAYGISNTVQLDTGANLGLTRATPDVEIYTGVSMRF